MKDNNLTRVILMVLTAISTSAVGSYAQAASGTFIANAKISTARDELSCTENSQSHKLFCFGGDWYKVDHQQSNQIFQYNPTADTRSIKSALTVGEKRDMSCVENSATHLFYCFGGFDGNAGGESAGIFEYNPKTDVATAKTATLSPRRAGHSCAEDSSSHKIYCFGGYTYGGAKAYNDVKSYDPVLDKITTMKAVFATSRENLSCIENSSTHKIYCFGGSSNGTATSVISEYNPATDTLVDKTAHFPGFEIDHSCAEHKLTHKIYCFGGANGKDKIREYDPSTDTITTLSLVLPKALKYHSCTQDTATYTFYCFGGLDQSLNKSSKDIIGINL